jgi:hypothetical protein
MIYGYPGRPALELGAHVWWNIHFFISVCAYHDICDFAGRNDVACGMVVKNNL